MANMFFHNGTDWINFLTMVYPVNSIYLTISDESPADLIGGTWSEIQGRLYLRSYIDEGNTGYGKAGTTGGTNYISVDSLPAHSHDQNQYTFLNRTSAAKKFANVANGYYIGTVIETGEARTQTTGQGKIHMPAYFIVHVWRRTA